MLKPLINVANNATSDTSNTSDTINIPLLCEQGDIDQLVSSIVSGQRLSMEDALWLYHHYDLLSLGTLASKVNEKKHGSSVLYNINRHINPTNICVYDCKFCAYAKRVGETGAYAYSIKEVVDKALQAAADGACEIHVVGGLHPRWSLDYFCQMLEAIKEAVPHIHIKGFTAVEVYWLAKKSRLSIKETLLKLRKAGLDSMPGGGAEIFDEAIRTLITAKLDADGWLDIHRTAHSMGMKSNATMLYGHIESPEHRIAHMLRLRDLQDETGGFNAFIPLSFQPHQNEMGIRHYTLGSDDLRLMALSRLVLDNFAHIKAYWIMLGKDIAQLALHFGANDLDGTVYEEKISHAAGGRGGMHASTADLDRMIQRVGKVPQRRTSLYEWLSSAPPAAPPLQHSRDTLSSFPTQLVALLEKPWFSLMRASELVLKKHYQHKRTIGSYEVLTDVIAEPSTDAVIKDSSVPLGIDASDVSLSGFLSRKELSQTLNSWLDDHIPKQRQDRSVVLFSVEKLLSSLEGYDRSWLVDVFACLCDRHIRQCLPARDLKQRLAYGKSASLAHQLQCVRICSEKNYPMQLRLTLLLTTAEDGLLDVASFLQQLGMIKASACYQKWVTWEIIAAPGSAITPSEYIQMLALARIWLEDVSLSAPLLHLPLLSPSFAQGVRASQHPGDKVAPLYIAVAANDLGVWESTFLDKESLERITADVGCSLHINELGKTSL
ncbi:MAG: aminofutalosine synthase MqnE [Proteobacteria bacterium]|nr:aminofutalosine synthase MqnE [Pseudomonadota bacterium]